MKELIVGGKVLKVKFIQSSNKVTAQILEQDDRLRFKGLIAKKNGFYICSGSCPQMTVSTLYIRGHQRSFDSVTEKVFFVSDELAKEYIENISSLIEEINTEAKWNTRVEHKQRTATVS